jgi:hypothetical protein
MQSCSLSLGVYGSVCRVQNVVFKTLCIKNDLKWIRNIQIRNIKCIQNIQIRNIPKHRRNPEMTHCVMFTAFEGLEFWV